MATVPFTPLTSLLFPVSSRPATVRWPLFLRAWLPVLLGATVFAIESTAAFGANRTSAPLHSLLSSVLGSGIDANWSLLHHLIRKAGHFTGYGLFSLLCYRGFVLSLRNVAHFTRSSRAARVLSHALAVSTAFLVAGADELHQSFLPNRTGCFADVLLDTAGALTLQIALFLLIESFPGRREPRSRSARQVQADRSGHLSLAA